MAKKQEFTFESGDGRTKLHAVEWTPEEGAVRGVLQIVHGMAEFVERYEEFADFLTKQGIVVAGHDHLGHGASIVTKEDFGFFCEEDGNETVLGDIHRMRLLLGEKYPGLPYYMMGHSMGSFLTRQYLYTYGENLDGAIIMGTGTKPMAVLKAGQALCRLLAALHGWRYRSRLVDKMAFSGYNKHFKPVKTGVEWLTREEAVQLRYLADERCTFRFTLNGFYNLFRSIEAASRESNLKKMPKDLPVLFVAGGDDPVGDYGKGVEQVRKRFQAVGMTDVTWIIYENDRHEILNETDRETVCKNLYAWLYVRMAEPRRKERGKTL